jgi:UDP-N-acetylmuramoyl-L-alanyl-D-glutamate--2,6-diaminopimelate ligase
MARRDHVRLTDRREAIAHALRIAGPHDVIVLAGKGHETYQIRGTTTYPFDESEIVTELSREILPSGGGTGASA